MRKPLRLHFTEIGLGGVSGPYRIESDPWRKRSMRDLRMKYHKCLVDFLKKTPTIQAAFLWNSNSWDVQGLYLYSRGYRDEDISEMIRLHNEN